MNQEAKRTTTQEAGSNSEPSTSEIQERLWTFFNERDNKLIVNAVSGLYGELTRYRSMPARFQFDLAPANPREPRQTYLFIDNKPDEVELTAYFESWARSEFLTGVSSQDLDLRPKKGTKLLNWNNPEDREQINSLLSTIEGLFTPGMGKQIKKY